MSVRPGQRATVIWLTVVYGMILSMVAVGGITRLTGSGLSMVEWHPLMGALPPVGEDAWLETFAKYKQSPQYLKVNHWMQLADFKRIFFWEYFHRLLGRTIGLVFFFPWVVLYLRKALRGKLAVQTAIAFVLGGLQGLLGWFMVKSGLVDVPAVSHLRLAAHLSLAFFAGMWVLWIILDLVDERAPLERPASRASIWGLVTILCVQIVYGAFMAGKRAGAMFNTFPDMNGTWFPPGAFSESPWIANLFNNAVFIHAWHRWLAWGVVIATLAFCAYALPRARTRRQRGLVLALGGVVVAQLVLGALVVIYSVPISIAAIHQVVAYVLLSLMVACAHTLTRR
jgi:cytochrome c oxidase assembly protein subunit 15